MMKLICFLLSSIILLATGCAADLNQSATAVKNIDEYREDDAQTNTGTPTAPTDTQRVNHTKANADILFVKANQSSSGIWNFNVTVEHPDTGWDDYADGWDVVLPDGTVVKANHDDPFTRLLLHPHESEQPFTRSQSNLHIPNFITRVTVRAHDLVDGWGGQEVVVDLTKDSGEGFEVTR